jgi:hypothetical protein
MIFHSDTRSLGLLGKYDRLELEPLLGKYAFFSRAVRGHLERADGCDS